MKAIRQNPFLVVIILLIIVLLSLSITPFVYKSFTTPPGMTYIGTEKFHIDYFGVSYNMAKGAQTSISDFKTILNGAHMEFLFMGKIGSFFNFNSFETYHISRLLSLSIFLISLTLFYLYVFKSNRKTLIALIFSFIITTIPIISSVQPLTLSLGEINVYQLPSMIERLTLYHHHYLGGALFIWVVYLIIKYDSIWKTKDVLKVFFLIILTGYLHSTENIILIPALFIFLLLKIVFKNKTLISGRTLLREVSIYIFFVIGMAIPLINFIIAFSKDKIANLPIATESFYSKFDASQPILLIAYTLLASLAIPFLFTVVFLIKNFVRDERRNQSLLFVSLIVSGLLFYFFSFRVLNMSRVRYLQVPFYMPFAIFCTYYVDNLKAKSKIAIILLLILLTLPVNIFSLQKFINEYSNVINPQLAFVDSKVFKGMEFLAQKLKGSNLNTKFLSGTELSNPAWAMVGRDSFLSDPYNNLVYDDALIQTKNFYYGEFEHSEANKFLSDNKIRYILSSSEEKLWSKEIGPLEKYYPSLENIFHNDNIDIYIFKN